jgi:hypothetical protein
VTNDGLLNKNSLRTSHFQTSENPIPYFPIVLSSNTGDYVYSWITYTHIGPISCLFSSYYLSRDRLCGLVVTVYGYRSSGSGFDSQRYQISLKVVGLERGPLSLVRLIEELFQGHSGSGLENRT